MRAQYIHNPEIFRRHFQAGRGLPGFSGSRVQRGDGLGKILGAIARRALPIIKAGFRIAKPHIKKAAKSVAKDVTGRVTQAAANKLLGRMNTKRVNKAKPKRGKLSMRKKGRQATSNDYFA